MEKAQEYDSDIVAMSFVTRLLLSDLDREVIADRAVECLADFGKSDRVGLFLVNEDGRLICIGGCIAGVPKKRLFAADLAEDFYDRIVRKKSSVTSQIAYVEEIPVPVPSGLPERVCMCVPLVAANNQVIGMVTFNYPAGLSLTPMMMQSLMLVVSVTAIAMETARLFQSAVYDGLTGLFIRRYFDLRLAEEENRIKRYGGKLAIAILDIDHFKRVNDNYGHPVGDAVLRESAGIIKSSVRKDVDSPCRYGGEEFAVILPSTDLNGALVLAERIRHRLENHRFPVPDTPFQATISGGVAFMDQDNFISGEELLKRADAALYRAKKGGRNRIQA